MLAFIKFLSLLLGVSVTSSGILALVLIPVYGYEKLGGWQVALVYALYAIGINVILRPLRFFSALLIGKKLVYNKPAFGFVSFIEITSFALGMTFICRPTFGCGEGIVWVKLTAGIFLLLALFADWGFYCTLTENRKNGNPLVSLTFEGTLGLLIGDSYKSCVDTLSHKGIPFEKDSPDVLDIKKSIGYNKTSIRIKNEFNNIEEISICFVDGVLDSFLLRFKNEQGASSLYDVVLNRVSFSLGCEPFRVGENSSKWVGFHKVVTLTNGKDLLLTIHEY